MSESATRDQTASVQTELLSELIDALLRTAAHYALWWAEVEKRYGPAEAAEIAARMWERWFPLQLSRLSGVLGIPLQDGMPAAIRNLSSDQLRDLQAAISVNWLACDGLWFQSVEEKHGMAEAQALNDAAWERMSPFEARCIKALLRLPDEGGLDALDAALRHRLYASINRFTIERPEPRTLILRMNDCRVQAARNRKGLPDYPCKSGGTIEYETFARTIDGRIRTTCIGCPPDAHPPDWYCAWKFTLDE